MNPYQLFATDSNVETNGVVLNYGDFKITVARAGGANKAYLKALENRSKQYRRQIQNGTLSNEQANQIIRDVYTDTVIKNWEGVRDRDGNLMPFNRENVIKLIAELPDLFSDIQAQANEVALFRENLMKEEAGN